MTVPRRLAMKPTESASIKGGDEGVEPLWVFGKELNVVHQRKVAQRQPISSNLNERGGDHGKPWHRQRGAARCQCIKRQRSASQRVSRRPDVLPWRRPAERSGWRDPALKHPHRHADRNENERECCCSSKLTGSCGIGMDLRGEDIKADAAAQCRRRAVLCKASLQRDEQHRNCIIAGHKRQRDLL